MDNRQYINFLLTFDAGYLIQATVTMTSVIMNLDKKYKARFFLFTSGLTDEKLASLNCMDCEIINIDVNKYLDIFKDVNVDGFVNKYINLAGNYRLLMFDILPDYIDKIVYLDCDIVVNNDISVIYEGLKEDKLASVVVEILAIQFKDTLLKHCYTIEEFSNFQKDSFKYPYFNSGFFVMNVKKAKEYNLSEQIHNMIKKYPELPYYDQDILNAVIGQQYINDLIYLDPIWNVFCDLDYKYIFNKAYYSFKKITDSFNSPNVFHFSGANKPWKNSNSNNYIEWWKYFFETPFRDDKSFNLKYKEIFDKQNTRIYELFNKIPIVKITKKINGTVYYRLFNYIPFIAIRTNANKDKYVKLFNFIPLLKIRH